MKKNLWWYLILRGMFALVLGAFALFWPSLWNRLSEFEDFLSWQTLEWYSRVYVLTDRRIIRRMGVLRVTVFETQVKNIQHTSVFKSMRERLFGLGSIGFATAGSDVFEAFWVMIDRPFQVHRIVVRTIEKYGK